MPFFFFHGVCQCQALAHCLGRWICCGESDPAWPPAPREEKQAPSAFIVSVAGGKLPPPGPWQHSLALRQVFWARLTQSFPVSKTQFPVSKFPGWPLLLQLPLFWDYVWGSQMSFSEESHCSRKVTDTRKWLSSRKIGSICAHFQRLRQSFPQKQRLLILKEWLDTGRGKKADVLGESNCIFQKMRVFFIPQLRNHNWHS